MSYFGGKAGKDAASRSAAQDMEAQNDGELEDLHKKIRSIRQVTSDIYNDSTSQNRMLDTTDSAFDSFKSTLSNTRNRLDTIAPKGSQSRLMLYVVGGIFALYLVWHFLL